VIEFSTIPKLNAKTRHSMRLTTAMSLLKTGTRTDSSAYLGEGRCVWSRYECPSETCRSGSSTTSAISLSAEILASLDAMESVDQRYLTF
jgi:hypothetical protein